MLLRFAPSQAAPPEGPPLLTHCIHTLFLTPSLSLCVLSPKGLTLLSPNSPQRLNSAPRLTLSSNDYLLPSLCFFLRLYFSKRTSTHENYFSTALSSLFPWLTFFYLPLLAVATLSTVDASVHKPSLSFLDTYSLRSSLSVYHLFVPISIVTYSSR